MMFNGSAEEQRYLTAIRKEKSAFEELIRQKGVSIATITSYWARPYLSVKSPSLLTGEANPRMDGHGLSHKLQKQRQQLFLW